MAIRCINKKNIPQPLMGPGQLKNMFVFVMKRWMVHQIVLRRGNFFFLFKENNKVYQHGSRNNGGHKPDTLPVMYAV